MSPFLVFVLAATGLTVLLPTVLRGLGHLPGLVPRLLVLSLYLSSLWLVVLLQERLGILVAYWHSSLVALLCCCRYLPTLTTVLVGKAATQRSMGKDRIFFPFLLQTCAPLYGREPTGWDILLGVALLFPFAGILLGEPLLTAVFYLGNLAFLTLLGIIAVWHERVEMGAARP